MKTTGAAQAARNPSASRPIGVKAWLVALIAGSTLGAAYAGAPETTATIRVRIAAPAALSSHAIIELRTVGQPASVRSSDLQDAQDAIMFRGLLPGVYRLTARLPGFRSGEAEVHLAPATLAEIVLEFCAAGASCTGSTARLAYTEPVGLSHAFDRSMLATFPGDDTLSSVVETTVASAIVDRMSSGGLWIAEAALIGSPGGSWRQTSVTLGEVDVIDPVRIGTPLTRPHREAAESLVVLTAMLPPSLSGPGPVLTVIPRSPPGIWQGAAAFEAAPPALQADNARPGPPSIARFAMHREWNAQIGGPLRQGAGLFLSTRRVATDRTEREDPARLRTSVDSLFASSAVSLGDSHGLRIAATVDRASMPYAGRARFPDRDIREVDTFATVQSTWNHWADSGTAWSASSAFERGAFGPALELASRSDLRSATAVVERLADGPIPSLFDASPGNRQKFLARMEVEPARMWRTRRHSPLIGGSVARNTAMTRAVASPAIAELVNGTPARLWEYEHAGSASHWASTEATAHVSDRVSLWDRASIDAGARIESARGSASGAAGGITWLTLAPRLAFHWVVDQSDRLTMFGGYSRYAHRLALDYLSFGDPSALAGQVYRWNDNGDGRFQSGERGVLIAAVGPCCAAGIPNQIDPHLQRPYTDELTAGMQVRFGDWSLRIVGLQRRQRQLIAPVNIGVTANDYEPVYVQDPGERYVEAEDDRALVVYDRKPSSFGLDRYLLTNPDGHTGYYKGVEATMDWRIAATLRTRFDGTAYHGAALGANRGFAANENDPGVIGELFENPNAATYARGHPFSDRGYVMKWSGQYVGPRRYLVSAAARYQDGQPFSRLVVVPDLSQGPEAISTYRSGRTRFTYTLSLDARVQKSFQVGRVSVAGTLALYNALNTSNEVEENVVTASAFRTSTAVQPPRATLIGLRIAF